MDIESLLSLETTAARLSATLDYNPALAKVWRNCSALTEAVASVALEDLRVPLSAVVAQLSGNPDLAPDQTALIRAEHIYRFMLSPGLITKDAQAIFDRVHQIGRQSDLQENDGLYHASYPTTDRDDWIEARGAFAKAVSRIKSSPKPIYLKCLALSSFMARSSPERHPISERLVFVAFEHALRKDLLVSDEAFRLVQPEETLRMRASWTFLPSQALSHKMFRAWSPSSASGAHELMKGLIDVQKLQVGRVGEVHAWLQAVRDQRSMTKNNTMGDDFWKNLPNHPVVSSASIRTTLGCSDKASRTLLSTAEEHGIIKPVTTRSRYRAWCISPLFSMLEDRQIKASTAPRRKPDFIEKVGPAQQKEDNLPRAEKMDYEESMDQIMADLDSLMDRSNALLEKYAAGKKDRLT